MYTILICDDDREIVDAVSIYMELDGYRVVKTYTGREALVALEKTSQPFHLIIMDLMMPELNGLKATRQIRENCNVPILMLTALSEDHDKVLGLNIGADDYLTKPFNPLELRARVKSLLRRYVQLGSLADKPNLLKCDGLEVDDDSKSVLVDGDPVNLTASEYKILFLLLKNKGKVFSSSKIYEAVWGELALGCENVVSVHIRHIREKIEINPREPRYLKVLWGQGYRIG